MCFLRSSISERCFLRSKFTNSISLLRHFILQLPQSSFSRSLSMSPQSSDTSSPSSLNSMSPSLSPPSLYLTSTSAIPALSSPRSNDWHLTACTWQTLTTLLSDQRFEVVDGVLVLQSNISHGSRLHQKIICNLPTLLVLFMTNFIVASGLNIESAPVNSVCSATSLSTASSHDGCQSQHE